MINEPGLERSNRGIYRFRVKALLAVGGFLLIGGCSHSSSSQAVATDKPDPGRSLVNLDAIGAPGRVVLDRHGVGSTSAGSPIVDGGILVYLNCDGTRSGKVHVAPSSPHGYASTLTLPCGTVSSETDRSAGICEIPHGPATISVTVPIHARWHLVIAQRVAPRGVV